MSAAPLSLAVAFAGGVFGAALGGLPVFVLCGLAVIAGTGVLAATGDPGFLHLIAWGPFLGPHAAFGGAAAAAAFAARRGRLESGRDVLSPLMGLNSPGVLIVGGLFGSLGHILLAAFYAVPDPGAGEWTNRMALVIVLTGVAARLLFGRAGLAGRPPAGRRWRPENERDALPWHARPGQVLIIGLAFALPSAWLALAMPAARGMLFGFAAVSLVFLQFGRKVPVTHHVILAAELFAAGTGSVWWGLAAGLTAAWLAELFACLFLIHADTHIDPPAMALAGIWSLYPLLRTAGAFHPGAWLPAVTAFLIGVGGLALFTRLRISRA